MKPYTTAYEGLKASGSGGAGQILRFEIGVPKRIRFLKELDDPTGSLAYKIHFPNYKGKMRGFTCTRELDCPLCNSKDSTVARSSYKYRIPVIDIDNDEVTIMEVGKMVMDVVLNQFEAKGTILDRNWRIAKKKENNKVSYVTMYDDPSEFDYTKYECPEIPEPKIDIQGMKSFIALTEGEGDKQGSLPVF